MEREKYIMRSFINCTLHIIGITKSLLGRAGHVRVIEINNDAYQVLGGKSENTVWKI
jgi:hypothetical protein